MPRKQPSTGKPSSSLKEWEILRLGKRATRVGVVSAVDEREALQKAIEEFNIAPRDIPRTLVRPR
jgi:hypothetical protein